MLAKNEEISESSLCRGKENKIVYMLQMRDVNYKPVYKSWKLLLRPLPLFNPVGYPSNLPSL